MPKISDLVSENVIQTPALPQPHAVLVSPIDKRLILDKILYNDNFDIQKHRKMFSTTTVQGSGYTDGDLDATLCLVGFLGANPSYGYFDLYSDHYWSITMITRAGANKTVLSRRFFGPDQNNAVFRNVTTGGMALATTDNLTFPADLGLLSPDGAIISYSGNYTVHMAARTTSGAGNLDFVQLSMGNLY